MQPRDRKITFNRDAKFDIQLGSALIAERKLAGLLTQKIEHKHETWQWRRSGNIAIEYRAGCGPEKREQPGLSGRPSGIASTEAALWFHELRDDDGRTLAYLVFDVARLKELCRKAVKRGDWRQGGDDNAFEMALIPVDVNRWLGRPQ